MNGEDIHYELIDDGGSNAMWIPIILPVETVFQHEYGTYKVKRHINPGEKGAVELVILCERM